MKRTIPLLITALSGLLLAVATFIPAWQNAGEEVTIWFDILASIAFILGGGNLIRLHLQQISDQTPGWGYSAITLVSFFAMLIFGLLKFGSPPESEMEAYGQSAVLMALSELPEYRIPGSIPKRPDGVLLHKSVRQQLREENGEILFQGWMTKQQADDMAAYLDTVEWKCQAQRLYELAQPPEELAGRVHYSADQRRLFFTGKMSENDREILKRTLRQSAEQNARIDELFTLSTRTTSHSVSGSVPEGFSIPTGDQEVVSLRDGTLEVQGPMTIGQREKITGVWSNAPIARPLNNAARTELFTSIEENGPLTEKQRIAFNHFFDADWEAEQLVAVVNTAGITAPRLKTACELQMELSAGEEEPSLTVSPPPPQTLNEAQHSAIKEYVRSATMTPAELTAKLVAAGPMNVAQLSAVSRYFSQQPTLAEQRRSLCFRLLEAGPLTLGQQNFLLDPVRQQFQWRQRVGELFIASQQVKYSWSGNYSAQGTPFWWIYEYALQPLMTTTFALLAFYVASAAYRAFRAKNLEAALLLGTAFLILIGRTSAGPALTSWLPPALSFLQMDNLMVYIMSIFNTAGNRAIMIGIALGTIATSLRVLLGVDRSYLGSSNK